MDSSVSGDSKNVWNDLIMTPPRLNLGTGWTQFKGVSKCIAKISL